MVFLEMGCKLTANGIRIQIACVMLFVLVSEHLGYSSSSLNSEGLVLMSFRKRVIVDPFRALNNWNPHNSHHCKWRGVQCEDNKVQALNLKGLLLEGTLAPELGNLTNLKLLILSNNRFSGFIPKQFGQLTSLEVLDLRNNNLFGQIPAEIEQLVFLERLVMYNNNFEGRIPARRLGEETNNNSNNNNNNLRAVLIDIEQPLNLIYHPFEGSSGSFSAVPIFKHVFSPPPPPIASIPSTQLPAERNTSSSFPGQNTPDHKVKSSTKKYISGIGGGAFLLVTFVAVLFFVCRRKGSRNINPWSSGLSGQLQNPLVKCVSKLNRVDLETACEDFSNIVQTNEQIIIYKGSLSDGTQIVVVSTTISSTKEWSNRSQDVFRKMVNIMSRVNHKNFLNLVGYCEENECFSRMMVFEYALNGTLAEHLQDVKDLDWSTRMKIGMGVCYCLQYMHNLNPPVPHSNVNSGIVYLTEDFTAKLGEVCFWSDFLRQSSSSHHISKEYCREKEIETNVYDFGIILLELVSGKPAYARDGRFLMEWAFQHLSDKNTYKKIADLSLKSFNESEFTVICEVIHGCTQIDARKRPNMNEITTKLRTVIDISPESASSKQSPIWWELLNSET